MASKWLLIRRASYILKRGDVVCLNDDTPEDVVSGDADQGYVVTSAAGLSARAVYDDYHADDNVRIYSKRKSAIGPVRLALHKVYSKPLPLP